MSLNADGVTGTMTLARPVVTDGVAHPPAAVSCQALSIGHGERVVLQAASFSIPAGSFVGLLGPNGAGKTTFLRALLGLTPVRSGELHVFGASPVCGDSNVGYMPQSRTPIRVSLTGRDMLASSLHGERWGLPLARAEGARRIDEALHAADAQDLAERRIDALSGGELQRLRLAQALLSAPRLLLLDEPLASFDPVRMREAALQIREVARRAGATVICSAHDIDPLLGVMDSVLYIARGRARLGSVDEVITSSALSDLYGAPVEVYRSPRGRVFVSADVA
ncbi:metal ABC transporter ATP-binding protein [Acetobacter sacchari]|nr:ATP-binding cassette domain-containing protein [Acetobacter sacchari]